VQLRIKDEFGKEETIDFSILFNRTLLDPGISEWSFAGGISSNAGERSPWYAEEVPVVTSTYRRGLSESVTGSASAQASLDVALTGVSLLSQTPFGLASVDTAISGAADGTIGWSASAELEFEADRLLHSLNSAQLAVEFISKDFVSSLNQMSNEGSRIRFSGAAGQRLSAGLSASVSAYYQLAEEESDQGFGTSFSLNRAVSPELTLSLSGSYNYRPDANAEEMSGLSLFARLNYRPTADSYATLQYDHASNTTTAASGSNFEEGARRTSVDVEWEHTPKIEDDAAQNAANADLYYADSRIEINASHGRNFERLASGTKTRRTTANAGVGFAFADGQVAFGRPVRGGYAIVDVHKSLEESKIRIAPFQDAYRAGSDGLGPLLISDISAYTRTSLPYDADNLPDGYDIGSGAFEFFAPYKAGFAVLIGSDSAVTAVGTLVDPDGKPLALQAGTVSTSAYPDKHIVIFTNAEGRFTVPGLKAGEWNIALNDIEHRYTLRIAADTGAYVELGNLQPRI
jgi:outer membrane usher protein